MGNYISCTLAGAADGSHARTIKVILPGSEVRRIDDGAASAAELMLDVPGHFIVSSRSMQVGRRFTPLAADEELEMGNVYVMFPMRRKNAVVTAVDMAGLLMAAGKEVRRASGGRSRFLPDTCTQSAPPEEMTVKAELDEMMSDAMAVVATEVREFKYRLSMCRSKRPTLETIAEEGVC